MVKKNIYSGIGQTGSSDGYQFDFYAGNKPKPIGEDADKKILERKKRTGPQVAGSEAKISQTAKFINDMYEYSDDRDQQAVEAVVGPISGESFKRKNLDININDFRTAAVKDLVEKGKATLTRGSLYALTSGIYSAFEKSADEVTDERGGNQSYSQFDIRNDVAKSNIYNSAGIENPDEEISQDEALGEIVYSTGGLQEAVKYYKKNKDLLSDRNIDSSEEGIISGATLDEHKKELAKFSSVDYRGMTSEQIKETQKKMNSLVSKSNSDDVTQEDIQEFQTNTKIGRKIKADQDKKSENLVKKLDELDKKSNSMYGGDESLINTATADQSRMYHGMRSYLNEARNLLESTKPGSVNSASEAASDIAKSIGSAAYNKGPNWYHNTVNAFSDIFGITDDPRKNITKKIENYYGELLKYEFQIAKGVADDVFEPSITEQDLKNILTKEEFDLLSSFSVLESANQLRADNQSTTWKIGQGVYDSGQFIVDMWIGGKGVGVASKTLGAMKSAVGALKTGKSLKVAANAFGKSITAVESAAEKAARLAASDSSLATELGEAAFKSASGEGISTLSKPLIKSAKYLSKQAAKGTMMTGTYSAPEQGEWKSRSTAETGINGYNISTRQKFDDSTLEDYASEAASNALSAFVEAGGAIRPGIKFLSAAIPPLGRVSSWAKGIRTGLGSSVSNFIDRGASKLFKADDFTSAMSKLWEHPLAKSLHVDSVLDELFEEWEESTLRGTSQAEFFEKDNLIVTAATVGIFSGGFGVVKPAMYTNSLIQRSMAEKDMTHLLSNTFGLSSEAVGKVKSVIDNTPVSMLEAAIPEIIKRVYEGSVDLNKSAGSENRVALLGKLAKDLNKSVAKYVGHNYKLSVMRDSAPKDPSEAEAFLSEAFGSIEGEIASKAVANVSNEDTGNVEKVFVGSLQREAFLISGADINEDGTLSPKSDESGAEMTAKIMLSNSGQIVEVPVSQIAQVSERIDPAKLISEIAEFNTKTSVNNAIVDPDGNASKRSNAHKNRYSITEGSEDRNPLLKYGVDGDRYNPSLKDEETGEVVGGWLRLVKDDARGTYEYVRIDKSTGEPIKRKEMVPVETNETELSLDKDNRKVVARDKKKVDFKASDDSYDDLDEDDLYADSFDDVDNQSYDSASNFDQTAAAVIDRSEKILKPEATSKEYDSPISESGFVSAVIGDVEDVFSGTIEAPAFTQKYTFNTDVLEGDAPSALSFLDEASTEELSIIINKLKRDASERKVDARRNEYASKTLMFVNKYDRAYKANGTLLDKESKPSDNSKVLLNGSWYDEADVSISSIALEVSGEKPVRAPLVTLTNPRTGESLLFTLKSGKILKAMLDSGKINNSEYDRAITLQDNILKAIKDKSGIDLAIGLGKPKMSSFRLGREIDDNGQPITPTQKTISDTNTGLFTMDPNQFEFCFRVDGILFSYKKGDVSAVENRGINDVGSLGASSMSMIPPVIENSKRDYTPILGPIVDSTMAAIVSEVVKADKNTPVSMIIDALGSDYMFGQDKFINGVLLNSDMTAGEFIDLFLTNESDNAIGLHIFAGNMYNGNIHIGNIKGLDSKVIENAILNSTLNLNLNMFFDEQMNLIPPSVVLKTSEETANDFFGNDLHSMLYELVATTGLDYGFYDPPFLFISERGEFNNSDVSNGGVTINGVYVDNLNDIPQDVLDVINNTYNRRSKIYDIAVGNAATFDDIIEVMRDSEGSRPVIEFKATTEPNSAAKNVMKVTTELSLKWLASKLFGADIITNKTEISDALKRMESLGHLSESQKKIVKIGKIDGFVYDGKVYLNNFDINDYGHEMAHLLVNSLLAEGVLPSKNRQELLDSIQEFAKENPSEIERLSKLYDDPATEYFCNQFGSSLDRNLESKSFTLSISHVFKSLANIFSLLNGFRPSKLSSMFYNYAAKYAFNSSMADFQFIKAANESKKSLASRCSDMSAFSKKRVKSSAGFNGSLMDEIRSIDSEFKRKKGYLKVSGTNIPSRLSKLDWLFIRTGEFKSMSKNGVVSDVNGEPVRLYIDNNNVSSSGFMHLSDKKDKSSNISGFYLSDNIAVITDESIIMDIITNGQNQSGYVNDLFFSGPTKYDAIEFYYNGKRNFIVSNNYAFASSSLTDSDVVYSEMSSGDALLLNKAILMRDSGHTIGSIIAATGYFPSTVAVNKNGDNPFIKIKFNDEDISVSAVKNAIDTGGIFDIRSLYTNEELLNSIVNGSIKVRIITSDRVKKSSVEYSDGVATVKVNSAVNKSDYIEVMRDVLFNVIGSGNKIFNSTPLYITTNLLDSSNLKNVNIKYEDERLMIAFKNRDVAIDMWNIEFLRDPSDLNMDIVRNNIFKTTGWYVSNSNSMTSSIFIDYESISNRMSDVVNGGEKSTYILRDFMPEFMANGSLGDVVVVFDEKLKNEGEYKTYTINPDGSYNQRVITLGSSCFKRLKNGSISINKKALNKAVPTLLHEASHAMSDIYQRINPEEDYRMTISPVNTELQRKLSILNSLLLDDSASEDKRLAASIAIKAINSIMYSDGDISKFTEADFIKNFSSIANKELNGYDISGKNSIRKSARTMYYETIFSTGSDKYIRSTEEAGAMASESSTGSIFYAPVFRVLDNFGTSIRGENANGFGISLNRDSDVASEVYFKASIPSEKPTVDVSSAFRSISRSFINSAVSDAKSFKDLRRIANNAVSAFTENADISGTTDIHAIISQHVADLETALSSTVTDFYSFINFIPYEYSGVIQVSNRDAVYDDIKASLSELSSDIELTARSLVKSINKQLINTDTKVDTDQFVSYFRSINRATITPDEILNNLSRLSKSRSYVDQKALKDFLYVNARNSSNVNAFTDKLRSMSVNGDPIAIGIAKMDKLATNLGMSNFYERLFTQFNQQNTSFLDFDTKNITETQLLINSFASIKKINSITKEMTDKFINKIEAESLSFAGDNNNTDGIIILFERLGMAIDKRTADSLYNEYMTGSVHSNISKWVSEIKENSRSGINGNTSIGRAILDIVHINNISDSAAIKKDGATYPAVSKFNAISQLIDSLNNMSSDDLFEFISNNDYRVESKLLNALLDGKKLKLHKQLETFSDIEDAAFSDILHILGGYMPLGKISTDGTRYYISGHNIIPKFISYNYESSTSPSDNDDTISDNNIIIDKTPLFSDFKKVGSVKYSALVSSFKKYAFSEIMSIISTHKSFSLSQPNLIGGFHIKNGKPGTGCFFTDYMKGIRLASKGADGSVYRDLNDAISSFEKYEESYLGSDEGVESLSSQLKNMSGVSANPLTDAFLKEVDSAVESGYLASKGAFARLMVKKLILTSGISIDGVFSDMMSNSNKLLSDNPNLKKKFVDLGFSSSVDSNEIVATAFLFKKISEIEASKSIFGSPAEYGSITKLEKRTQSWNTTYSVPVEYDDMGVRPNGEEVPLDFYDNSFKCAFGSDLTKSVITGPYAAASDTLGTVMISPSLYREMLIRSRGWSDEAQKNYDKLIAAGKNGGDFNAATNDVKFNPLKLIYVGEYVDGGGVARKTMIKAQFIPLFSDKDSAFGDLYERFNSEDENERIHMYAMEDSVKLGFSDGGVTSLKFSNLGMISIPRDTKKKYVSLIRKLLLFNDPNFHSAIESDSVQKLSDFMGNAINEYGVINAEFFKSIESDQDGIDMSAAFDEIIELQKIDPTVNPLDFVGMFDVISRRINAEVANAFDFKMKGTQCSAVTERFFTSAPLEFVNSEGTMDVMVPMDYFGDIVKGLSYNDAVKKLTDLGYINGPLSNTIVVRNPAQAHSSISPAKITGVFPRSYGFCISAPSEFLNANGGDYDGDKYFLFSVSNEGTPESNKLMFDLLKSQRRTMEGDVDFDMNQFTSKNAEIEDTYPGAIKTSESKDRYVSGYKSEVSGLGLVGVCVNMISGLLSFIKHDMSFEHDGNKIVRSKDDRNKSLSVVSALFSLAVDIATNPLLQDLGVSSRSFKMAFAIAAVSDVDTTVKFLHSNLAKIKPEPDGLINFDAIMSPKYLNKIITESLANPTAEVTDDQQVVVNTISKLGTMFITLKHSDDYYDFMRNNGYFDSVLQAVKIKESVDRIVKSNKNITSFSASNVSSTGIANSSKKLEYISTVLSNSSDFMSSEFITKFFESMMNEESGGDADEQYYDSEYSMTKKHDKSNFESFKTKIVLDKIVAYVSDKIGRSIFSNYKGARLREIRNYMMDEHNISFAIEKSYIHSVTASKDTLYKLGEIAEPGTILGDFFSVYYASAAQAGAISEENKKIKKLRDSGDYLDDFDGVQPTSFMRHPGGIVSMKHAVKFGASSTNSNILSQKDISNFSMHKSMPHRHGYEKINRLINSSSPILSDSDGNNIISIIVNNTVSSSSGAAFESFRPKSFNVKGSFDSDSLSAIKDLIFSIENRLPFVNTTLNDVEISAAISAISEYNAANGIPTNIHIASSDSRFISSIRSGAKTTSSELISDAKDGSIIITKNLNSISYSEPANENGVSVSRGFYDIADSIGGIIINVNRNVRPQLGFGNITTGSIDHGSVINRSDISKMLDDYAGYNFVDMSKSIDDSKIRIPNKSKAVLSVTNSRGATVKVPVTVIDSTQTTDKFGNEYFIYSVRDSKGNISQYADIDGDMLSVFNDLNRLNKTSSSNVIVLVNEGESVNLKKIGNIKNYKVIGLTDSDVEYVKSNISADEEINKMCTI